MWRRNTSMSSLGQEARAERGQTGECMHENRFCYEDVLRGALRWMIRSVTSVQYVPYHSRWISSLAIKSSSQLCVEAGKRRAFRAERSCCHASPVLTLNADCHRRRLCRCFNQRT